MCVGIVFANRKAYGRGSKKTKILVGMAFASTRRDEKFGMAFARKDTLEKTGGRSRAYKRRESRAAESGREGQRAAESGREGQRAREREQREESREKRGEIPRREKKKIGLPLADRIRVVMMVSPRQHSQSANRP